jgi:hypothetical protein
MKIKLPLLLFSFIINGEKKELINSFFFMLDTKYSNFFFILNYELFLLTRKKLWFQKV